MLEAEVSLEGDASWVQMYSNFVFLFLLLLLQTLNILFFSLFPRFSLLDGFCVFFIPPLQLFLQKWK